MPTDATRIETRVHCYRVCDRRYPFLWVTADQPPGRWHGAGEGPCHYLATTAKGAWAEIVRHEQIAEVQDLLDLDLSLWDIDAPQPRQGSRLEVATLTGNQATYRACRKEALRLRGDGAVGLVAPSAAVLSGLAEQHSVDQNGSHVVGVVPTETMVLFGAPVDLIGMSAGEGHPDPTVLADVRYF